MRVPDEVRKCVVFLAYVDADGQYRFAGTGFFFATPAAKGQGTWVDVVTAKHVIQQIEARAKDGMVWLRMNQKKGGVGSAPTPIEAWVKHPDQTVDVAVLQYAPPPDLLDVRFLGSDNVVTEEVISKYGIGIGDEVFITGLFFNHAGSQKNIPILRAGNIAAMPEEPVNTMLGPMDAYLIEARSLGGLSGSPVYVYLDPIRMGGEAGKIVVMQGGPTRGFFFLLGLMHGHYKVDVKRKPAPSQDLILEEEAINMGIAIAVPVARIVETINLPERATFRQKYDDLTSKGLTPES
ncbi:MAG TPA: hypothetical protein VKW04_24905 [Planctomycetota bacterium]|nr:hypothetical protein [Planctomycetota bacterium]